MPGGTRTRRGIAVWTAGLSWESGSSIERVQGGWIEAPKTPSGDIYDLRVRYIVLLGTDGESRVAYSSAYLQEEANLCGPKNGHRIWTQFGAQRDGYLAAASYTMNAAATLLRRWETRVLWWARLTECGPDTPSGAYSPTDFSFTAKTRLLLVDRIGFWAASLALSLSMTGFAARCIPDFGEQTCRTAGPHVPIFTLGLLTLARRAGGDRMGLLLLRWPSGGCRWSRHDPLMVVIVDRSGHPVERYQMYEEGLRGSWWAPRPWLMSCLLVLTLFSDSSDIESHRVFRFLRPRQAAVLDGRVCSRNLGRGDLEALADRLACGARGRSGHERCRRPRVYSVATSGYRNSDSTGVVHSAGRPYGSGADGVPEVARASRIAGGVPIRLSHSRQHECGGPGCLGTLDARVGTTSGSQ